MTIRCAIYTRKSTEDGLEQEFNSLQAQREACEAYITSQRSLGWRSIEACYDDGGVSGGTLERPALRRLLTDVANNKVDLVVVYKVDRLTRSLTDFAKLVERFDAQGISFVSVTQQFNTTTSMGRLTLNMLLSFAQFEREVTGERIRDKIAASKKKGMWMGGLAPLGYDPVDKKLVVNSEEAKVVAEIFNLYLKFGTVKRVVIDCGRLSLKTKRRRDARGRCTGGSAFTRGHLYQLLRNPIYVGDVTHKGIAYPGRHEAIIDRAKFEAVQRQLLDNAANRRSTSNVKARSLLTGLVFDETGDRLCPTHANKQGRRYRYYISKRLMHKQADHVDGWRFPAPELERISLDVLKAFLLDERCVIEALTMEGLSADKAKASLARANTLAAEVVSLTLRQQRELLLDILHRIELGADSLRLLIDRRGLSRTLMSESTDLPGTPPQPYEYLIPANLRRRGVEARLVLNGPTGATRAPDARLVELLARAHHWHEQLTRGHVGSVKQLARDVCLNAADVGRTLQLAYLAPDIIEAILSGDQPVELTPRRLMRIGALPLDWADQRKALGFPAVSTSVC